MRKYIDQDYIEDGINVWYDARFDCLCAKIISSISKFGRETNDPDAVIILATKDDDDMEACGIEIFGAGHENANLEWWKHTEAHSQCHADIIKAIDNWFHIKSYMKDNNIEDYE